MKGNFAVGLLEIVAYLIPGSVSLFFTTQRFEITFIEVNNKTGMSAIIFLVASYTIGHMLTQLSGILVKVRSKWQKFNNRRPCEQRLEFYPRLLIELENMFGYKMKKSEQYLFCLRLIADNMVVSNQSIDRLYALTLFCRNMIVSFLLILILYSSSDLRITVLSLLALVLFFSRYLALEESTANTVLRSAYIYLLNKQQELEKCKSE
jgi:hypothetical protein